MDANAPVIMKSKIGLIVGVGIGTALYQAIRYGFNDVDWSRAAFVSLFAAAIVLFLPRRWFEKNEARRWSDLPR
jgi:high-affinity Fe2+/Pb2+ permease